ncbi:diacylglycerol kinase [Intrasporangium sp.]|uniref:diacylglycerol kinase n=1 Tax=Intrasporangium sp. TaxID=1925024 RepID=UPI0029395542|nr:diacylglycerol kinase [Intrasporangium sp.]MDV3222119.1 diacylglycerol kinase [Intrasporangium sp.]
MSERVALIVNPMSGRGAGRVLGAETRRLLLASGREVVDASGLTLAEASRCGAEAVREGVDALVVVGGDGLVHLGVNLVAGTTTPLGVVAAGTGNDFARNLGLPVRDAAGAVDVITGGLVRTIDAGRATGPSGEPKWFGGVLGAGFDAVVTARAGRMRWPKGQMRYNLAVLRELPVFKPIPYVVVLDGRRVETSAMLVAVANTSSFGGGMRVCPDADPCDGLFDVLIVRAISVPRFLRVFPTVYSGAHVTHPAVEIQRAARVRLEADHICSQADGEPFTELPLDIEIVPHALRVLAPRGDAQR